MTFEYVTVGDFTLRGEGHDEAEGTVSRVALEFGGFKANSGLDDKLFEDGPAESRPAPPVR